VWLRVVSLKDDLIISNTSYLEQEVSMETIAEMEQRLKNGESIYECQEELAFEISKKNFIQNPVLQKGPRLL